MATSVRYNFYKHKANSKENLRKKRQESNIQLRKDKRGQQMLKRRNIGWSDVELFPEDINCQENTLGLEEIVMGIQDDKNPQKQFQCTRLARKILSHERHPPITKIVETNIIHKFVEFLNWKHNPIMQFEAAWALTNIASGDSEQTLAVVNCEAVPSLVNLLSNSISNVAEQAMWALGNITGDGAGLRDYVLSKGIVEPLVALANQHALEKCGGALMQNLSWTISNLCRNKNPCTKLEYVMQMLPTIVSLVHFEDIQVKIDACWALSYITDGPNNRIEIVLNSGVLETLVNLLHSVEDCLLLTPLLRVVGNMVTGTDQQIQRVIDFGMLGAFNKLLVHEKPNIQKEVAWTISNITAGTQNQIQAVVEANIMSLVVQLLLKGDHKTQKEACWALTNFTSGASVQQMMHLCNYKTIFALCRMLKTKDIKVLQLCLDGISNFLKTAKMVGSLERVCLDIENCGGVDGVENLLRHENETIYTKSLHIIDEFNNDEKAKSLPPPVPDKRYFRFDHQGKFGLPVGGFRM